MTKKPNVVPTDKQKEFVKDIQKTHNATKSVQNVYGYNKSVANKNVNKILNSEGVRTLMADPKVGLNDGMLLDKLKSALDAYTERYDKGTKKFIKVEDWTTQMKALELAFKLKGYLSPRFNEEALQKYKEITVNFNLVKARDAEEVKELLGDMPSINPREAILDREKIYRNVIDANDE